MRKLVVHNRRARNNPNATGSRIENGYAHSLGENKSPGRQVHDHGALVITDRKGRIEWANPASIKLTETGLSGKEYL